MPKQPRVLIVEDETAIREGLVEVLRFQNYEVESAVDGVSGLQKALAGGFDLLLLDVMLPGVDGFSICEWVREAIPWQAICMLTAKGSEADVLQGFEAGADDYVTKPFSVKQLLARVQSLLRRAGADPERTFQAGPLSIDRDSLQAAWDGKVIDLSQRDIDVLACLARDCPNVATRQQLLQEVWEFGTVADIQTRCVDMHLVKLRRKMVAGFGEQADELIETVRGVGYRLREDVPA